MNVLFFLQRRIVFIRDFYRDASSPFDERKRKIEASEEPFEPPPYDEGESTEPPFLEEWMEASESLDVLGQMCISMLSSSLRLYLQESVDEIHKTCCEIEKWTLGDPENSGLEIAKNLFRNSSIEHSLSCH
jgi:hypothetical protein